MEKDNIHSEDRTSPLSLVSLLLSVSVKWPEEKLQELMGVSDLFLSSLCNYTGRDGGCQYWISSEACWECSFICAFSELSIIAYVNQNYFYFFKE